MNLLYRFLDLFFAKKDLDRILGHFNKLNADLDKFLDNLSRAKFGNAKLRSRLSQDLAQLDADDQDLDDQAARAQSVQDKVRMLCSR